MPLPVSAQVYQPNPMLGIEASQAGLQQGQGIVLGGIKAAQGTQSLLDVQQQMEMRPQELQLQKDEAAQRRADSEQRADQFDLTNARLERNQTSLEENRQARLENDNKRLSFEERRLRHSESTKGATEYLKLRTQQEEIQNFEAMRAYVMDGNTEAAAFLEDNSPSGARRQMEFIKQAKNYPELAKAWVDRFHDEKAKGVLADNVTRRMERTIAGLEFSAKFSSAAEDAQATEKLWRKDIGVVPDRKAMVGKYKTKDGGLTLHESFDGGKTWEKPFRSYDKDELGGPGDVLGKISRAEAIWNRPSAIAAKQKKDTEEALDRANKLKEEERRREALAGKSPGDPNATVPVKEAQARIASPVPSSTRGIGLEEKKPMSPKEEAEKAAMATQKPGSVEEIGVPRKLSKEQKEAQNSVAKKGNRKKPNESSYFLGGGNGLGGVR